MGLAYEATSLDGIDQAHQSLYAKGEDGIFRLQVDGVVPKSKLDEFRQTNVNLMKEAEKFKNIDPTKYAELLAQDQALKEKKLIDSGDVDGLINSRTQAMKNDYETRLNGLNDQLGSANRQLETLLVDNAVRQAANELGVLPTAVEDLILRAKSIFRVKDGSAIAIGQDGHPVIGKDGTTPLSIKEWGTALRKIAPHLFAGSQGSGSNGSGQPGSQNRDRSKMTPAEMIRAGMEDQ